MGGSDECASFGAAIVAAFGLSGLRRIGRGEVGLRTWVFVAAYRSQRGFVGRELMVSERRESLGAAGLLGEGTRRGIKRQPFVSIFPSNNIHLH